jgi:glutamine amidotransferase
MKGELFKGLTVNDDLYFVHSYYAEISSHTSATCDYIVPFSAAMQKDNFFATQFHPEKSAGKGEILLKNFLKL